MINDLDMQSWAYLLDPTFQFVNTAGKPLTEGYLEVYIAGTRDKYYCASDFDGTLHPFQIPLDSLGANIVLADPNQAYDVYVYNRFGSLIMSRYNVSPGNTGSDGVSMTTVTSQDNTINITHSGNNYDLSIKDTIDRIDNLEAQYGNLGASTDYAVSYGYGDGGEFVLTDKASTGINYLNDMSGWRLKPGHVYQLNYNAKFTCDEQTNKLVDGKFYLDGNMSFSQDWNFNLDDSYDYTQAFNGSTIIVVPSTLQYYDLKLKYTFNSIVNCQVDLENISIVDITSTTNMGGGIVYTQGDGIIINEDNSISVDMDYINDNLDIDASSILSSAYNYTDARVTQASGDIINIIAEATANIPPQVQSDWSQDDDTQVDYIKNKPDEEEVEFEEINLSDYALASAIPSIEGLATVAQVSSVSSVLQNEIDNIPEQVQSNWTEDDTTDPSYILNKPNELELIAGENIGIFEGIGTLTIAASATDLSNCATHYEVYSATSTAINSANSYTDTAIANIDLTPAVEIVSPNNTISVSSTINQSNNTKTFYIDTNNPDTKYYTGEARFTLSDTSSQGTVGYYKVIDDYATRFSGNIDLDNLNKGLYLLTANINCVASSANNDLMELQINSTSGSAITYLSAEYPIDCSVVDTYGNPSEVSHQISTLVRVVYDGSKLNLVARIDDPTTVSNELTVWISDLCLYEINTNSGSSSSSPSASGSYEDGWGIIINGNVISVNPSIIPDTSNLATHNEVITYASSAINVANSYTDNAINNLNINQYATHNEVYNSTVSAINSATAIIPDVSDMATQTWVNSQGYLTSIPTSYATDTEVYNATVTAIQTATANVPAQVQSDWNEIDVDSPAYIDNKPDLSIYATETQIETVSGDIVALIPNPQIQSDWAQTASDSVDFIKNKPEIEEISFCPIIAGNNITITASGDSAVISSIASGGTTYTSGDYIDITNNVISVDTSDVVDIVPGSNVTITVSGSSAIISSTGEPQVQSDWNVSDSSSKAYIKNKPTIPAAQVQSNWNETNTISKAYIKNKPTIHTYTGASGINIANDVVSLDNPVGLVAGENITITVSGSSAIINGQAGGGTTYSAGNGININNDEISIDNTVALKSEIPDTSDMATQTWVGNQGYLTSIPATYATDVEVTQAVTGATQNMVSYTGNTAINHIQLVSTLPGSPDANTLYLIPEV